MKDIVRSERLIGKAWCKGAQVWSDLQLTAADFAEQLVHVANRGWIVAIWRAAQGNNCQATGDRGPHQQVSPALNHSKIVRICLSRRSLHRS
jgi:hypothetical protein